MTFNNDIEFAQYLKNLGGTLYRVGGSVRDEIMTGKKSDGDKDYAVAGLESLPFKLVGVDFPVYLVEINEEMCEVALCRTERKTGKGYNGFEVSIKNVTIEQDLARRDLTINAMAINVLTDELIDPFNGFTDTRWGVLKHTSEAFAEDPLRILRVARFAAKYPSFDIDDETIELMKRIRHELSNIPGERIAKELFKVYEQTNVTGLGLARIFFDVLKRVDALQIVFPEIHALDVPDKHDGTSYNHVMDLLKYAKSLDEFLGLLAHDLGKGLTDPKLHPSHFGHEELGRNVAIFMAKRLRLSKRQSYIMAASALTHMNLKRFTEMRLAKQLRMVLQYDDILNTLVRVSEIDSVKRDGLIESDKSKILENFCKTRHRIEIIRTIIYIHNGDFLIKQGIIPDSNFGHKLEELRITELKNVIKRTKQK